MCILTSSFQGCKVPPDRPLGRCLLATASLLGRDIYVLTCVLGTQVRYLLNKVTLSAQAHFRNSTSTTYSGHLKHLIARSTREQLCLSPRAPRHLGISSPSCSSPPRYWQTLSYFWISVPIFVLFCPVFNRSNYLKQQFATKPETCGCIAIPLRPGFLQSGCA